MKRANRPFKVLRDNLAADRLRPSVSIPLVTGMTLSILIVLIAVLSALGVVK